MTKDDAIKLLREYFSEDVLWNIVDAITEEQLGACDLMAMPLDESIADEIRTRGQE